MSGSHIPNGLAVMFSITTLIVFLYPIIKLAPSWLERSMGKKIILHRSAIIALGEAIESTADAGQRDRLLAQLDYHQAAIDALVPGERAATQAAAPRIDAAA